MIQVASAGDAIWIKAVEVMFMAQDRSSSRRHYPYPKFLLHLLVLGVIIDYPSYYPLSLPQVRVFFALSENRELHPIHWIIYIITMLIVPN